MSVTIAQGESFASLTKPVFHVETVVATSLGKRLRAAMAERGAKNADVAKAAGVHVKTVSQWLSDKQVPSAEALDATADFLHQPVGWLRYGTLEDRPELFSERVSEQPFSGYTPRVALGLPQRIRVFIQQFLLELVNANVPEERVDTIRRILSSDEMYRFYVGGEPKEYSEEETLEGIQAHAEAFRQRLRRQGFDLVK